MIATGIRAVAAQLIVTTFVRVADHTLRANAKRYAVREDLSPRGQIDSRSCSGQPASSVQGFRLATKLLFAQRLDWIQLSCPARRNATGAKTHQEQKTSRGDERELIGRLNAVNHTRQQTRHHG